MKVRKGWHISLIEKYENSNIEHISIDMENIYVNVYMLCVQPSHTFKHAP